MAESLTCDGCGKTVPRSDYIIGWLHLETVGVVAVVTSNRAVGPWDFCSESCLAGWAEHGYSYRNTRASSS